MEQQRASQRYEETWLAFTEELKSKPDSNSSCNLQKATHQSRWYEQVGIKTWLFSQPLQGFTIAKDKCPIILIRSYRTQRSTGAT